MTVLLAVSAGFMISKFVAVNEMNQQVASLKSQLTTLESATSQMVFDLEQSVDLTEKLKKRQQQDWVCKDLKSNRQYM